MELSPIFLGESILSGNAGNPSATKVVKAGWEDIFDGDDGGQAWVYPKTLRSWELSGILIPNSTSSMSGLQVGVASLSTFFFDEFKFSEPIFTGFGFYHLANGSEVENFGTTQRDTLS